MTWSGRSAGPAVNRAPVIGRRETCLSLCALTLASCQGKSGRPGSGAAATAAAPRFTGKTLSGDYLALSDQLGKVVLFNVWATWCKPCRKELPELQRLHTDLGQQGFSVIGVSVDRQRAHPQVEQLVAELGITFPIVLDAAQASVQAFKVRGYPTNLVIGRDGSIRWRRDGIILPQDAELDSQLRAALAVPAT